MDPDNRPSLPELLAAQARDQSLLRDIAIRASEKTEQEALMPLWQYLGDHTASYHHAFIAAQIFRDADDAVEKAMDRLPNNDLRLTIMEALGRILIDRSACLRDVLAKKEELERKPSTT